MSVNLKKRVEWRVFRSYRVAVRDEFVTLSLLSLFAGILTREGELRDDLAERCE